MSHTPGPWYVADKPPNGVSVWWSEDGQVCPMRWTDGMRADVNARVLADASLIAAAPELLALVKRLAEHFTDTDAPLGLAARAVIAQAEGQP